MPVFKACSLAFQASVSTVPMFPSATRIAGNSSNTAVITTGAGRTTRTRTSRTTMTEAGAYPKQVHFPGSSRRGFDSLTGTT
jgi:hypothetical protein